MPVQKNLNNNHRGLHVVVINKYNGKVELAKCFDTWDNCERFDHFIDTGIPEHYIVVAACKDECTKNLSTKAR